MNDIVSMRKMRPCEAVPSSTQAAPEAARDGLAAVLETLLATSWPAGTGAADLEVDDLERGDNPSSLTAQTRLEFHAEISLHVLLLGPVRVITKKQVIPGGLIHGMRKARIYFSRGRVICGEC